MSSFSIDSSDRAFYKDLKKVIEASDVILEVLDARDPLGTRCVDIEKMVMESGPDKRLVLLLNKIGNSLGHHFPPFLRLGIYFFH
jgi:ribosome biogenesis GTPase A